MYGFAEGAMLPITGGSALGSAAPVKAGERGRSRAPHPGHTMVEPWSGAATIPAWQRGHFMAFFGAEGAGGRLTLRAV
jgi:hypothetical protein